MSIALTTVTRWVPGWCLTQHRCGNSWLTQWQSQDLGQCCKAPKPRGHHHGVLVGGWGLTHTRQLFPARIPREVLFSLPCARGRLSVPSGTARPPTPGGGSLSPNQRWAAFAPPGEVSSQRALADGEGQVC